jgi:N-acetylmuramoyl-L-alanine amidase CwlA
MANVVEFIPCSSRNCTSGRQGRKISKIVVHYTATGASAHNNLLYFSREYTRTSAHFFIDKDGALRQSVAEADTAWHAGNWEVNLCSIGIEVVSAGEDFTEAQIATLASLAGELRQRYGISAENVVRHYDVTGKICPAPYIDAAKWSALHARICGEAAASASTPSEDVRELAQKVIDGQFGNGEARRAALGSRYDEVQAEVNRILGATQSATNTTSTASSADQGADIDALARRAINGEFGNGEARRARLGSLYDRVQARVNEILRAGSTPSSSQPDIDALARATINGDYGNGEERRRRLGANYDAVQRRVNELLS